MKSLLYGGAPHTQTGNEGGCRDEMNTRCNKISDERGNELIGCEGTTCYHTARALTELLAGYSARIAETTANRAQGEGEMDELAVFGIPKQSNRRE